MKPPAPAPVPSASASPASTGPDINPPKFLAARGQVCVDEDEFLAAIEEARKDGYFFTPLVGAGLSLAAGIPTTPFLQRYLAFCFVRLFNLKAGDPELPTRSWNPRRDPWPSFSQAKRLVNQQELDECLLKAIRNETDPVASGLDGGKPQAPHPARDRIREAYGALADWRTALQLLSRLVPADSPASDGTCAVEVREPDTAVIDSFFRHLVRGRQPALGHRLLHSLSSVLRFSTILTTNFDDLIEDAFQRAGEPLQRFEVAMGSPLPAARLVLAQRSIVKLHGGQFGLRADYSLDQTPSVEDVNNFLGYLAGGPCSPAVDAAEPGERPQVALLVTGVGLADERSRALLRAAIRRFPRLRVFWLGFSENDRRDFVRFWTAAAEGQKPTAPAPQARFLIHHEQALLLLHLYQHCMHDLPPSGAPFPALWNLPFPPQIPLHDSSSWECLQQIKQQVLGPARHPLVVRTQAKAYGGVTLGVALYSAAEFTGWLKIWLDLDDIACPDGVLFRIQLILARRCGIVDPLVDLPQDVLAGASSQAGVKTKHADPRQRPTSADAICGQLFGFAARLGQPCLVILNAQQGPGCNSFFSNLRERWQNEAELKRFFRLLQAAAADHRFNMRFVLLVRDAETATATATATAGAPPPRATAGPATDAERAIQLFFETLTRDYDAHRWLETAVVVPSDVTRFEPAAVVEATLKWAAKKNPARRWRCCLLRVLTQFRIGRYLANLSHAAVRIARDLQPEHSSDPLPTYETIVDALSELGKIGLVRHKPGGVLWMHYQVRELLKAAMSSPAAAWRKLIDGSPDPWNEWWGVELLIAKHLTRGYGRLLLSAAEPMPAFEGIHHVLTVLNEAAAGPEAFQNPYTRGLALKLIRYAQLLSATVENLLERRVTDQLLDWMLLEVRTKAQTLAESPAVKIHEDFQHILAEFRQRLAHLRLRTLQHQSDFQGLLEALTLERTAGATVGAPSWAEYSITAHIGRREYGVAEKIAREAWNALIQQVQKVGGPAGGKYRFRRRLAHATRDAAEFSAHLHRHAHQLGSQAATWIQQASVLANRRGYGLLNAGQAAYLAAAADGEAKGVRVARRKPYLDQARYYLEFSLGMLRNLGTGSPDTFRPNARVRAHLALVCALQAGGPGADARWGDAWKYLSDAEAFVVEYPAPTDALSRGVLEMRRAEILLILVTRDSVHAETRGDPTPAPAGPDRFQKIATSQARVYEALRALERAERYLENYPKSRWWWWIHVVLRTKCAEVLLAIRSFMARDPAASADLGTIPPDLRLFLNEGLTVWARTPYFHDFFQMARLVRSYQECVKWQTAFLSLRAGTARAGVNFRLREIDRVGRANLRGLVEQLEILLGELPRSRLKQDAVRYSHSVLNQARAFQTGQYD